MSRSSLCHLISDARQFPAKCIPYPEFVFNQTANFFL